MQHIYTKSGLFWDLAYPLKKQWLNQKTSFNLFHTNRGLSAAAQTRTQPQQLKDAQ